MSSKKLLAGGVIAGILFVANGMGLALFWSGAAKKIALGAAPWLFFLWFSGHYWWHRDRVKTTGLVAYVVSVAGSVLFVVWETVGHHKFGPAFTGVMMVCCAWGFLLYGTATLSAGIAPRAATICWLAGVLLVRWKFSHALVSVGVLWSSLYLGFQLHRGHAAAPARTANPQPPEQQTDPRDVALDLLRGLIIVLMAIDHASVFVRKWHPFEIWNQAVPYYADAAPFLTRGITHLCAPGFFFLMGAGTVMLAQARRRQGWSDTAISRHLVLRGILIMAIEPLVINTLFFARPDFTNLGVLYGLGGTMVLVALLVHGNRYVLLALGTAIVLLTQVIPGYFQTMGFEDRTLVRLLLIPGTTGSPMVLYPIIPWTGIAALGMAFGTELLRDRQNAYGIGFIAGIACVLLFTIFRTAGGFGNFQDPSAPGWIHFLNVVKYPPSLVFTLLTLGINLILLYGFAKWGKYLQQWLAPLRTFGTTALFFYVAHWFMFSAIGAFFWRKQGLPILYLTWAAGLLLLYPICRCYGRFKRDTAPNSVWRSF